MKLRAEHSTTQEWVVDVVDDATGSHNVDDLNLDSKSFFLITDLIYCGLLENGWNDE